MPTTLARRPLSLAVGLATVLIASLLGFTTPWQPETAHALTAAPSGKSPNFLAWRVLKIVNKKRVNHGRKPLKMQSCDRHYAKHWGNTLAKNNWWKHSDLWNLLSDCHMSGAGENLIQFPDGMTPKQIVSAWMHSSGHRANILRWGYRLSGVYFVWDSDQGVWYGVQEFSSR